MISTNVHHVNFKKQHRQEAILSMHGLAFTRLIHNLIREYGTYHDGSYAVDVNSISMSDKKLVISHMESAEWYEWACETPSRIDAMFDEHSKYIQGLVDGDAYEVYQEDQEEMRTYK